VTSLTEIADFPFVKDLPKREKSKVAKIMDVIQELEAVTKEKGPVIPQALIADVLQISKQRVNDLLNEGRMEFYTINGVRFVFSSSFREFAKQERKPGRPPTKSLVVQAARSLKWGAQLGVDMADAAGVE
jgi:predicted XRE-type DNA-binding protein